MPSAFPACMYAMPDAMPLYPKQGSLCDALLGANWNPYQLPHVCILGNRFSTYAERWSVAGASPAGRLSRPDKLLASHDTGMQRQR